MFGLIRTLLGRMRYRRRWSVVAAAATAAADTATAAAGRQDRGGRHADRTSPPRPGARTDKARAAG